MFFWQVLENHLETKPSNMILIDIKNLYYTNKWIKTFISTAPIAPLCSAEREALYAFMDEKEWSVGGEESVLKEERRLWRQEEEQK